MRVLTIARMEFLSRLRTESLYPALFLGVVAVGAIALFAFALTGAASAEAAQSSRFSTFGSTSGNNWRQLLAAQRGSAIFFTLAIALGTLAAALGPIAGCAALNRARHERGIEGVLLTGVGPLTIVSGKLLAALVRTLLVLAAAAPFFAVAWLFRGVPLAVAGATAAIIAAVALLGAALAIFLSSAIASRLTATLYTYALLALITAVGPVALAVAAQLSASAGWLRAIYFSSPLALLSLQPDLVSALRALLPQGVRFGGPDILTAAAVSSPAPAHVLATVAGYVALSGLLLVLSSALLDPFHPLRGFRPRQVLTSIWHKTRLRKGGCPCPSTGPGGAMPVSRQTPTRPRR